MSALVGRDRDPLDVLLDRRADHLFDTAVVSEVDDLGTLGLQYPAHDVDRGVVPVEKTRRRDEAHGVLGSAYGCGISHRDRS
ncbi:unannotated protein [freshwater metagenome]|uniref:Unannotated protein n=1 Tax=freshwater metagenome TaxID=449393 RepID=A0A6J7SIQ1_9ZZZZ